MSVDGWVDNIQDTCVFALFVTKSQEGLLYNLCNVSKCTEMMKSQGYRGQKAVVI